MRLGVLTTVRVIGELALAIAREILDWWRTELACLSTSASGNVSRWVDRDRRLDRNDLAATV
jgi:hypothetical protein